MLKNTAKGIDRMHCRCVNLVSDGQMLANQHNESHQLVEGILAKVIKFHGWHVSKESQASR